MDITRNEIAQIKRNITIETQIPWQEKYDNAPNGRLTYKFYGNVSFYEQSNRKMDKKTTTI